MNWYIIIFNSNTKSFFWPHPNKLTIDLCNKITMVQLENKGNN